MSPSNTLKYTKKATLHLQNVNKEFQIHNLSDDFQLNDMPKNVKTPLTKKWFLL